MADKGMLLVERMAMLGDSIASVKATLKAIVGDDTKFGADAPAQELSLTLLTAVWKSASVLQEHISARRAKMEEDPSKIPEIPGEDHAEFREIFVTQHPDMILTVSSPTCGSPTVSSWSAFIEITLFMVLSRSTRSLKCVLEPIELCKRQVSQRPPTIFYELFSPTTRLRSLRTPM